ncbi:MAG TPA: M48 family metallopeptidase [Candidatus Omnitrophota bacterium]|nr:M48 family metallopeptidase [Candidatus Omnitrophota bacterium]
MTRTDEQSRQYHRVKNTLSYVTVAMDVALLTLWIATGASAGLAAAARVFSKSVWLSTAVYLAIFQAVMTAVHFPFDFFTGYQWEHRYGLSTQTFPQWLKDEAKKAFFSFLLVLVFVEMIYFFLRRFPFWWWAWAAGFWLLVTVFLSRIMPQVIVPLFYKYVPVEDAALKERVQALFKACAVGFRDVYAIKMSEKTRKANAFICGLGRSRRVILSDTLLANFSLPQIEAVVAHELGHHKEKHILKIIAVNTAGAFLAFLCVHAALSWGVARFGFQGLDDIGGFPLLLLMLLVFGLAGAPFSNALSRHFEYEADRFSLALTRDKGAFISMLKQLGDLNLAETDPHWFNEMMFHDHPPLSKRIRFAQNFQDHS